MHNLHVLHQPIVMTTATKTDELRCLIMYLDDRIGWCDIPKMHVTKGTRFGLNQNYWRIEEVQEGCEGYDRVLVCAREYS